MSRILESTNYDKFDLLEFNRDLHDTTRLEKSMLEHGFIDAYPIHVVKGESGKLMIKGGHHRFVVARKLKIPVKYVVCDDNVSIHELEKTTAKWTLKDYLDSYIRLGYTEYMAVREYQEKTGLPLSTCMGLLGGNQNGGNFNSQFKDGTYRVRDNSIAEPVGNLVLGCAERGVEFARIPSFVEAIAQCVLSGEFDCSTFMNKVSVNIQMMKKQASKDGYLDLIESVYNYKSQNKLPLAFLARESARKRNAARGGKS